MLYFHNYFLTHGILMYLHVEKLVLKWIFLWRYVREINTMVDFGVFVEHPELTSQMLLFGNNTCFCHCIYKSIC